MHLAAALVAAIANSLVQLENDPEFFAFCKPNACSKNRKRERPLFYLCGSGFELVSSLHSHGVTLQVLTQHVCQHGYVVWRHEKRIGVAFG